MTLSIIIPCFNESSTLEELLRRVEASPIGPVSKEIIIVAGTGWIKLISTVLKV